MRVAICEDNQDQSQCLEKYIESWSLAKNVSVDIRIYESAEAFLFSWPENQFDVAFLDIQMKRMTGVQLAEHIRQTGDRMSIIFVTALTQYVFRGYDVDALHYIIKPITHSKVIQVMDKACALWSARKQNTMLVAKDGNTFGVPLDSIFYISMLSHTAEIHTDKDIFTLRKTAASLNNELPEHFIQCHRSFIINLFKVDCILKDSLTLTNGKSLPISRNQWKSVHAAFIRFHVR